MKLFYSRGTCAMAVHFALYESSLPFTAEPVNLATGQYNDGDYTRINPKGYVPAIQLENGEILTEVAALLQYVGDKVPGKKLIPAPGTLERFRCNEWLSYIATEIHKGFSPLWDDRLNDEVKGFAKESLAFHYGLLSKHLDSHRYLLGDQFGVADCYLFAIMNWNKFLKIDLAPWPQLTAYMARVKERPAAIQMLKAETTHEVRNHGSNRIKNAPFGYARSLF